MGVLQEHGEKADLFLVMLFLRVSGGPLGGRMCLLESHCSRTLDGFGAFLHSYAPEQTLENKCHKWKAFNS